MALAQTITGKPAPAAEASCTATDGGGQTSCWQQELLASGRMQVLCILRQQARSAAIVGGAGQAISGATIASSNATVTTIALPQRLRPSRYTP
ncbi:MAG TPA: hypothetical protein VNE83_08600 [Terriglobales bacterium]|nr:hypothetical protein [Terriglobales bacterium]